MKTQLASKLNLIDVRFGLIYLAFPNPQKKGGAHIGASCPFITAQAHE